MNNLLIPANYVLVTRSLYTFKQNIHEFNESLLTIQTRKRNK